MIKENWYKTAARSVEQHIKDTINADLDSPIFITEKHEIIDGAHRTAKAYIYSKKVDAIILSQDEINEALLPEKNDYVGQIYRDEDKNEYSVTKLIELYGDRPTETFDPEVILKQSKDVWGKVSIEDIIRQVKKLLRH